MDDHFDLYLKPDGFDLDHLPASAEAITIQKTGGDTVTINSGQAKIDITTEHPQVEHMEGDWGAICEVFRKNNYYYASITGVNLAVGDQVTVRYTHGPGVVTLKVVDIENGRARIDPPMIGPK